MPDTLRSFSLSAEAQTVLERARKALPELAAEAEEAERLRQPTDKQIQVLRETGVFELLVPRCYGGLEQDLDAFLEIGLTLGEASISAAWVACFYVEHNWILCHMPEAFQRELFATSSHILAPAVFKPDGEAVAEGEGVRIRGGRWAWGSGAVHGDWVLVGTVAGAAGSEPTLSWVALPRDDVRIDDTWYMDGMQGTGSHDIVIDDAFVPAERIAPVIPMIGGAGAGARIHDAALYRTPMIPVLSMAASMPIVGQARAVVRAFRERLLEHERMSAPGGMGQKAAAQMRLARADFEVRQAEMMLRDTVADVLSLRETASPLDRTRWASSFAHAVHQAKDAIASVLEGSGGSAHQLSNPLQRALRDANAASCHIVFDRDTYAELHGQLLLGLEPSSALF